jgi:hypothetical protein
MRISNGNGSANEFGTKGLVDLPEDLENDEQYDLRFS